MDHVSVGIDLGTSNSVIAVVSGETATVIADANSSRVHPSVVSFHPSGKVVVGEEAKRRRSVDPNNTVYSCKRLMGRQMGSSEVKQVAERMPYAVVEGNHRQPVVAARGQTYTIPEISAFLLRNLAELAAQRMGLPATEAVITVPANFDDAQREATRAAGRIAGLDVLRVLNEPTAAALAYGCGQSFQSRIVVYDFGGGTFDVTCLQLDDNVFEVLSTAGDSYLGGDDIDVRIADRMAEEFLKERRVDLRYNVSAMARLRGVAEQVKCRLSVRPKANVRVREIAYGTDGEPLDLVFCMTSDQLAELSEELVHRTFLICDEAMRLAGLTATQIDEVVLVGGTTRMPIVREGVRAYFGVDPQTDINPDEVVAIGAAIQAAALTGSGGKGRSLGAGAVLLDVTPRALGIALVGGYADTIIPRNAQIPVEHTRVFATSQDNQSVVRIQVCQGESNIFQENHPLGELVLEGLRAARRGEVRIEVTFEVDTDGILQVRAIDLETGRVQKAHVQLTGGLSEEEVTRLAAEHSDRPAPIADVPTSELPR